MKLYLAGPMRGYPDFNFPAFDAAADALRAAGYDVFNPADRDRGVHGEIFTSAHGALSDIDGRGFSLREALHADAAWICRYADGIAVLDGWEQSSGARAEVALGTALGIPVKVAGCWPTISRATA